MYVVRGDTTSLRIWIKIVLLVLLLGSGGAAVPLNYGPPGNLPTTGRMIDGGRPHMVMRKDGSLVLYLGSP
jgi:hypothetical protein